jgi:hypothetical protein
MEDGVHTETVEGTPQGAGDDALNAKLAASGVDCTAYVVQSPAPTRPIRRGMMGQSLLAYILVSKFDDQLPLYRLGEILARLGPGIAKHLGQSVSPAGFALLSNRFWDLKFRPTDDQSKDRISGTLAVLIAFRAAPRVREHLPRIAAHDALDQRFYSSRPIQLPARSSESACTMPRRAITLWP